MRLISLSSFSQLYVHRLMPAGPWECRRCVLGALDGTVTATFQDRTALLFHLEDHRAARHLGAPEAIQRLLACESCLGKKTVKAVGRDQKLSDVLCPTCSGSGLNSFGESLKVRRP